MGADQQVEVLVTGTDGGPERLGVEPHRGALVPQVLEAQGAPGCSRVRGPSRPKWTRSEWWQEAQAMPCAVGLTLCSSRSR